MDPPRRFSIALLMATVFLVAVNFALVRALWDTNGPQVGIAVVTLPSINLLLLAAPRIGRGRPARPFWIGFEATGWVMVLAFAISAWIAPDAFFFPIDRISEFYSVGNLNSPADLAFAISTAVVLYSIPLILVATAVGRLIGRYRLSVERR